VRKIISAASLGLFLLTGGAAVAGEIYNGEQVRLAPSHAERPVPPRGTHRSVVLQMFGNPAIKLKDASRGSDVWDYGTFRVFFVDDEVQFARPW